MNNRLPLSCLPPSLWALVLQKNTVDAAKLGTKVGVNTAIGAPRLGYRGGQAAYNTVRDARTPEGQLFSPGTALCPVEGGYVQATKGDDGRITCSAS